MTLRKTTFCIGVFTLSMGLAACGSSDSGDGGGDGGDGAGGGADASAPNLCGNGTQDPGEGCDDGNQTSGDGCDDQCIVEATPTAFMVKQMTMADPHMFAVGAFDVTDTVDQIIKDGIEGDADDPPDGNLDFAIVSVHRPLSQTDGTSGPLDIVLADCTFPIQGTSCARPASGEVIATVAQNGSGACMAPDSGTTGGYDPPVVAPSGPCFATGTQTFEVKIGDIVLPLEDARMAATYVGDPATSLSKGLIKGFVTVAAAEAVTLPEDILVVGGQPLSSLLKDEDKDIGPNGDNGWWFYLNFTAELVPYTD